jgi:hypothetical protein
MTPRLAAFRARWQPRDATLRAEWINALALVLCEAEERARAEMRRRLCTSGEAFFAACEETQREITEQARGATTDGTSR